MYLLMAETVARKPTRSSQIPGRRLKIALITTNVKAISSSKNDRARSKETFGWSW